MPRFSTTNAIIFDEGSGYLLVKALAHGWKGKAYLVRSLVDGQLDLRWANLLPASYAPAVAEYSEYPLTGDALYFKFCNGGDLRQFAELHTAKNKNVSEDFIWHYLGRMTSTLARLHYGWTECCQRLDPHFKTVIHRDAWGGNVFLDWSSCKPYPDLLLGDWGTSQYLCEGDIGRGPTTIGNDIHAMVYTLLLLCLGKPLDSAITLEQVFCLLPSHYSLELRKVAAELASLVVGTSWSFDTTRPFPDTMELVENLIPLATTMIAKLTGRGKCPTNVQWTRPMLSDQPLLLDDQASFAEWCAKHNDNENLTGKWSFVPVEKETGLILRRSPRFAVDRLG